jgi:signal transduction histidine kinase
MPPDGGSLQRPSGASAGLAGNTRQRPSRALRRLVLGLRRARHRWSRIDLWLQFTIATSAVLIAGMVIIGQWITERITEGLINTNAAAAALYIDSFVEPHVQELKTHSTLSPESQVQLDSLLVPSVNGELIVGFRIWKGDTIVYSNERELIGRSFPSTPLRERAWAGHLAADLNFQYDPEHARLRLPRPVSQGLRRPVLEIYAPVRETGTNRIIALAETYQVIPTLSEELEGARLGNWIVVALVTFAMIGLQFIIVRNGSRTIQRQRAALSDRIAELSRLLRENTVLRQRAADANRRVTEMNERYLRQVGSDLHDGPVQLLAMAVLRLDALSAVLAGLDKTAAEEANEDISVIREALVDSLNEIRDVSAGFAPAEVEKLSLAAALDMAARRHERRTGSVVKRDIRDLPKQVPLSLKACLYRFTQEGLVNAFRHAGGQGQEIVARCEEDCIEVSILDRGPGLSRSVAFKENGGQGLIGLRDRVESLGGEFSIDPRPGGGTVLTARLRFSDARPEVATFDA